MSENIQTQGVDLKYSATLKYNHENMPYCLCYLLLIHWECKGYRDKYFCCNFAIFTLPRRVCGTDELLHEYLLNDVICIGCFSL